LAVGRCSRQSKAGKIDHPDCLPLLPPAYCVYAAIQLSNIEKTKERPRLIHLWIWRRPLLKNEVLLCFFEFSGAGTPLPLN